MSGQGPRSSVTILTSSYPRRDGDMAGHFVARLARELFDPSTTTVLRPWDHTTESAGDPPFSLFGETVIRLPCGPDVFYGAGAPVTLQRNLAIPRAVTALFRFLHTSSTHVPPDSNLVAHWMLPAGLAAWRLSRTKACRYQLVVHGSDAVLLDKLPLGHRLVERLCLDAEEVIAVSETVKERLLHRHKPVIRRKLVQNIRVCPMGVDRPMLPGESYEQSILWVGRMHEGKGGSLLLDALERLPDVFWPCHWLGDGPLMARWQKRADRLPGEHHFHGCLPNQEVLTFLARRPLVVFTSLEAEGQPVSLMEAMAHGCPVMVPGCQPFLQMIQDQRGAMVYTAADAEDLARTLRLALSRPETLEALGRVAHQRARAFSWPELTPRLRPPWSDRDAS